MILAGVAVDALHVVAVHIHVHVEIVVRLGEVVLDVAALEVGTAAGARMAG